MIITLAEEVKESELSELLAILRATGWSGTPVKTKNCLCLVVSGNTDIDLFALKNLPGVKEIHNISEPYKLVSNSWGVSPTVIELGDGITVKKNGFSIIAGPCAIESEEQIESIISHMTSCGVGIIRAGAFKPRTSPYSFQGRGIKGLQMVYEKTRSANIKICSEVTGTSQIEQMYDYVDIFQVGTRNSQNFELLHSLGSVDKPVLLKRAMSGTIEELLQSAEYVFTSGNERLILCERGIRTFEKSYRNTLDLNAVPVLKEKSHLPVIVDPSHGVGVRRWIEPMALAAVMAGADGVMYEVTEKPDMALSDGQQTLDFEESKALVNKMRATYSLRKTFS
jgi:3-deoxy-7-phosphoheptulonate synthase